MKLPIYQIDAFTEKRFGGNPAAVIPLAQWIDEALMQSIAAENNLAETVFFVPSQNAASDFDIRWFTPETEINLCGHATLASAYVLFEILGYHKPVIRFGSHSGILLIQKENGMIAMDFPSWKPMRMEDEKPELAMVLGDVKIVSVYRHRDLLVELEDEAAVKNCQPDFNLMKKHFDKLIITAKGDTVDFVSRFFAPGVGINEDPVTGSAHSQLIPFWNERLQKEEMNALQLSSRGGVIKCRQLNAERVMMSGHCVFYMQGEIEV